MGKNVPVVEAEHNPKVAALIEVEEAIKVFKAKHYAMLHVLEGLCERYNQLLEDAEKDVRAKKINCGPFTVCGYDVRVDVDKLFEELGEEDFKNVGGTMEKKVVLGIDKKKFEALVESGQIPEEITELCFKKTLKYHAPDKVRLP